MRELEPVEERLHVRIALHLLIGEGLSVAAQELSDTQRGCRVAGADEDQAAVAVGDERHPPQDEGAHEDLAELEVPLHESAQMLAIDDDDRSVAESPAADEGAAGGQHVDLAREFPGTVDRDLLLAAVERAHDLDGPFDDDEEAGVLLPRLEQHLAGAHAASLADSGDPAELSGGQLGEHLVAAVDVGVDHRSNVRRLSCSIKSGPPAAGTAGTADDTGCLPSASSRAAPSRPLYMGYRTSVDPKD